MAFLEDLDKKLTMLGQGAIQKTKEVTDSAKLLTAIKSLEQQQKEAFGQLGFIYYKEHTEDISPSAADVIHKIKDLEQQIEARKSEMQKMKGTILCPNCNAEIPNNSLFCNVCGAKIEAQKPVNMPVKASAGVCVNCGAPIEEGQQFCMSCGTPISIEMPNPPESGDVYAESQEEANELVQDSCRVCANCGALLEEDQQFCINCGTPVAIEVQQQPEKGVICPNCGKEVSEGMRFCTSCGTKIE